MRGVKRALVLAPLLGVLLAGCIGDDATVTPEDRSTGPAEEAVATAQTGSIRGQVMTLDLEPVVEETVALLAAGAEGPMSGTLTDLQGRFTFNGLAPGGYRIHVAPECCVEAARDFSVEAGIVTDVNLLIDRKATVQAFIVEDEWTGFVACSVGQVTPCGLDSSDSRQWRTEIQEGLQTLLVGMAWRSAGPTNEQLRLTVDRASNPAYGFDYVEQTAASPIRARVEDSTTTNEEAHFANISESAGPTIRILVRGPTVGAVYQQAFTIYWYEYYFAPAPEDFDPVPVLDG